MSCSFIWTSEYAYSKLGSMHSPWFIRLYGGLYTDRQVRHLLSFAGLSCPSPRCVCELTCVCVVMCVCACVCVHVCVSVYARPVRSSVYIWCRRLSCHVTREVLSQKSMSCGPETGVRPQPAPLPQSHTRPSSAPHLKKNIHLVPGGTPASCFHYCVERREGWEGVCWQQWAALSLFLSLSLFVLFFHVLVCMSLSCQ